MSKRVSIVTRVSTAGQKENTSPETQEKLCRRKASEYGWEVVAVYNEVESGKLYESRVVTQQALEDLEADKADVLMLYDMYRYGRDIEFQQKMLKRITRVDKQLQFATLTLEYDPRTGWLTPESENVFNSMGSQSSVERSTIARRMYNGMVATVESGSQVNRTTPPFGYHIVTKNDVIRGTHPPGSEGKYILDEKLRPVIVEMYERYDRGDSLHSIGRWLTISGVKTRTNKPNWRLSSLSTILSNEIYAGVASWGKTRRMIDESRIDLGLDKVYSRKVPRDQWLTIEVPPIVSRELWDRVQAKKANARAYSSGRRDRKYMLTGLVRCHVCGRSCTGQRRFDYHYYYCSTMTREYRDEHPKVTMIQGAAMEKRIIDFVLGMLERPEALWKALEAHRATKPRLSIVSSKDVLQRKLKDAEAAEKAAARAKVEAMVAGQDTTVLDSVLAEYTAARIEAQAQLAAIAAPLEPSTLVSGVSAADVRDLLTSADVLPVVKGEALQQIMEWIMPDAERKTVTVAWRMGVGVAMLRLLANGHFEIIDE